jgi:predicted RNase H-like HicB family nuclease
MGNAALAFSSNRKALLRVRQGLTRPNKQLEMAFSIPLMEAFPMKIKVIIHEAEEGGFWATVPALPGCVSEGDTWEEIRANIREAIECYLDVSEQPLPEKARIEVVEV